MKKIALVLLAACLGSSCVAAAVVRSAADVTGDVVRGAVDVVTPGGDDKDKK